MKRDMSDSIYVTISAGMKGLRSRAHPTPMEDISPVSYAKKKVVIVARYAGKLDEVEIITSHWNYEEMPVDVPSACD